MDPKPQKICNKNNWTPDPLPQIPLITTTPSAIPEHIRPKPVELLPQLNITSNVTVIKPPQNQSSPAELLQTAASTADWETLDQLLKFTIDFKQLLTPETKDNLTNFWIAAFAMDFELANKYYIANSDLLLQAINPETGYTPLHHAAFTGNLELARYLHYKTPLFRCCLDKKNLFAKNLFPGDTTTYLKFVENCTFKIPKDIYGFSFNKKQETTIAPTDDQKNKLEAAYHQSGWKGLENYVTSNPTVKFDFFQPIKQNGKDIGSFITLAAQDCNWTFVRAMWSYTTVPKSSTAYQLDFIIRSALKKQEWDIVEIAKALPQANNTELRELLHVNNNPSNILFADLFAFTKTPESEFDASALMQKNPVTGRTPLHVAIAIARDDIAEKIIALCPALLNEEDFDGNLPMELATTQITKNYLSKNFILLSKNIQCKPQQIDNSSTSKKFEKIPMHLHWNLAIQGKWTALYQKLEKKFFIDFNETPNKDGVTILWLAAKSNQWQLIDLALSQDTDCRLNLNAAPKNGDDKGKSVFWLAAYSRVWNVLLKMLKHSVNIHALPQAEEALKKTPLELAMYYRNQNVINALWPLVKAEMVKSTKAEGLTLLFYYAIKQKWDLVADTVRDDPSIDLNATISFQNNPKIFPTNVIYVKNATVPWMAAVLNQHDLIDQWLEGNRKINAGIIPPGCETSDSILCKTINRFRQASTLSLLKQMPTKDLVDFCQKSSIAQAFARKLWWKHIDYIQSKADELNPKFEIPELWQTALKDVVNDDTGACDPNGTLIYHALETGNEFIIKTVIENKNNKLRLPSKRHYFWQALAHNQFNIADLILEWEPAIRNEINLTTLKKFNIRLIDLTKTSKKLEYLYKINPEIRDGSNFK